MNNLFPFKSKVTKTNRLGLLNQKPKVIWFTGLSGSGKSTLATHLEFQLYKKHYKTYLLDGDNVRAGLNSDLDFSDHSRTENIRRIGEVAKLFHDSGLIVLCAFISPFGEDRNRVRKIVGAENFLEVFVDCPLEICEQRDIKGLYKKARSGEIKNFTGISSSYDRPVNPDITINTHPQSLHESLTLLFEYVLPKISYP